MATNKIQGYQALSIVTSDNANVPYTVIRVSGECDTISTDQLNGMSGVEFIKNGVKAGDIVVNTITGVSATVTAVIDSEVLQLNANIFTVVNETYTIYAASAVDNYQDANNGCVLYIGKGGAGLDLKITPLANQLPVVFKNVKEGFFPVQVKKVWKTGTTCAEIIALW
jgi:hypothetical protein